MYAFIYILSPFFWHETCHGFPKNESLPKRVPKRKEREQRS